MPNEPTVLDLFSGIGGFSLAFESAGFRTVAFSEIDPAASAVLNYWWPDVPNVGPIEGIGAGFLETFGRPDVITGGVPCQPASLLGGRRGSADERWLWPEAIRLVRLLRPSFAVFENPPALLTLEAGGAFNGICSALAESGYDLLWEVVPACIFGAGHIRERLVIIAADCDNFKRGCGARGPDGEEADYRGGEQSLANPASEQVGTGEGNTTTHGNSSGRGEGRQRRPAGNSAESTEQALRLDAANGDQQRRGEAGASASVRATGGNESRPESASHGGEENGAPADGSRPRLEGHAGNGAGSGGRTQAQRPASPPDLRGRVNRADWWHEHVTGIPVLVHGLPSKLVEAACRCSGNAIVPQVFQPIAQAIYEQLI